MKLPLSLVLIFLSVIVPSLASAADTSIVEKHFTKKQLADDVAYMVSTIDKVHPNMYHSISRQRYQKLTDSVMAALHNGMSDKQAWPLLARLVGALNEGHSTFSYPDSLIVQMKKGAHILFPVLVREFDGANFVVRADLSNEDKLLPGDKITAINGISATKLVDMLSGYAGGLKTYRSLDVCRNLITYIYLYNIKSPYRLSYIRDNKPGTITVNPIAWNELVNHAGTKAKTMPKAPAQADYAFSYLDKDRAYLSINSLTADPAVFKHFLDSAFTLLKNQPAKKLVIDLRRNGGGNSALGEALLGYITGKPFRMAGGVKWKVSQPYKDMLNERTKGEAPKTMAYYFNAVNGTIISDDGVQAQKPADNPLRYYGAVDVLIGPHTFSSANMLANTIQDYKLATLIGQPSGEPANDYGELIQVRLPNTGFTFFTSTKQFVRANGNAADQHPVLPDRVVVDNPATANDEVLDATRVINKL